LKKKYSFTREDFPIEERVKLIKCIGNKDSDDKKYHGRVYDKCNDLFLIYRLVFAFIQNNTSYDSQKTGKNYRQAKKVTRKHRISIDHHCEGGDGQKT
jgi:hypothetical protein